MLDLPTFANQVLNSDWNPALPSFSRTFPAPPSWIWESAETSWWTTSGSPLYMKELRWRSVKDPAAPWDMWRVPGGFGQGVGLDKRSHPDLGKDFGNQSSYRLQLVFAPPQKKNKNTCNSVTGWGEENNEEVLYCLCGVPNWILKAFWSILLISANKYRSISSEALIADCADCYQLHCSQFNIVPLTPIL